MAYDISTAGSRVYISAAHTKAPDPHAVAGDFSDVDWLYLGDTETPPTTGATADIEDRTSVGSGVKTYMKGAIGFSTLTIPVAVDTENDAQMAARDALRRRCGAYAFRIENGADCGDEETVAIGVGDPAEVTWAAHGLKDDTPVSFSTSGQLPAPLRPYKVYFVLNAEAGSFEIAERPGGEPIETTEAGSGTHKAIAMPPGSTDMFFGIVTGVERDRSGAVVVDNIAVQQTSFEVNV